MQKFALDYKDICLIPKFSTLISRSHASTQFELGGRIFELPLVNANMATVIDESLSVWLAENRYFYIMHRFGIDTVQFCKNMREKELYTSISVGVNDDSKKVLQDLENENIEPDYICIDIAHGHSILMYNMIQIIKYLFPNTFIIAGNIVTKEAVDDLTKWGAHCAKVGIAQSAVCTTFPQTGFGLSQFSAVLECAENSNIKICADGSIKTNGDIAKAIVAGADFVMSGGLLAAHIESPGLNVEKDGIQYKEYYGSASQFNKGSNRHVEGKKILIPIKGSIKDKYREIKESLQSSISYAGGNSLESLRSGSVKWFVIK